MITPVTRPGAASKEKWRPRGDRRYVSQWWEKKRRAGRSRQLPVFRIGCRPVTFDLALKQFEIRRRIQPTFDSVTNGANISKAFSPEGVCTRIPALSHRVSVVPICLSGMADILPPWERKLRPAPMEVHVAKPLTLEPGTSIADATARLQQLVEEMSLAQSDGELSLTHATPA